MKLCKLSLRTSVAVTFLLTVVGCYDQFNSDAEIKITNGVQTELYPAVVPLTGTSLCTGTFIDSKTVLTAAHCVTSGKIKYGEIESESIKSHPEYVANGKTSPYDLAVVIFPENTAPATAPLRTKAPEAKEKITIVGYGNNDQINKSGAGTKRVGYNTVEKVVDGFIKFQGTTQEGSSDGKNAISGQGDSGGPLFIGGFLAGITSGGGVISNDKGSSSYVDLHSEKNQNFLKSLNLIK